MRYTEKWAWGKQAKVKRSRFYFANRNHSNMVLYRAWTTIRDVDWMRLYRSKIQAIQTDEQAHEAIYAYQREVAAAITEMNKAVHDE